MKIIDKLTMPMSDALRMASENAGKGKEFKDLDIRVQRRIKLWNLGEWWRWHYFLKNQKHNFIMWQHKHNFRCRCVTHYQNTGKHAAHCPKSKEFRRSK